MSSLRFALAMVVSASLMIAPSAAAQATSCPTRTVPVVVLNAEGIPVTGLSASDFRGEYRGRPLRVTSATFMSAPHRIAVVLDGSPSMRQNNTGKWTLAQEIAGHILSYGPEASYSFATMGGAAPGVQAGDNTRPVFVRTLEDLIAGSMIRTPGGPRGPIFDLVRAGRNMLETPQPGDVVFLVTDGGEEGSKTKPAEVQQELLAAGVRLFAVTLPMRYDFELVITTPGSGPPPTEQREATDFLNLVTASAGKTLRVQATRKASNEWGFRYDEQDKLRLATALQAMYLQIAYFYRVEVELPETVERPTRWKLEVVSPDGKPRKGFQLSFPGFLVPCRQPATSTERD